MCSSVGVKGCAVHWIPETHSQVARSEQNTRMRCKIASRCALNQIIAPLMPVPRIRQTAAFPRRCSGKRRRHGPATLRTKIAVPAYNKAWTRRAMPTTDVTADQKNRFMTAARSTARPTCSRSPRSPGPLRSETPIGSRHGGRTTTRPPGGPPSSRVRGPSGPTP